MKNADLNLDCMISTSSSSENLGAEAGALLRFVGGIACGVLLPVKSARSFVALPLRAQFATHRPLPYEQIDVSSCGNVNYLSRGLGEN
jgi:hypothetical protein